MRLRSMQWVVEWNGKALAVLPLIAVEARNLRLLRDRKPVECVMLGVYPTEHDAKVARRVLESEEDFERWRSVNESV